MNGINAAGDIVGTYTVSFDDTASFDSPVYCPTAHPAACVKGFIYRHGQCDRLVFPGHPGAVPQRITPNGNIYGCLHDLDTGMSMHGAIWYRDGSVASLTTAGGELSDLTVDVSMSMNNGATPGGHVIVGLFNDVRRHGVVVQDGVFSVYDMPSATIKLTAIRDINTPGTVRRDVCRRNGPSRFPAESRRLRAGPSRRHRADEHHRHGDQFQRRDRGHVYYRHRHAWTWIHRCADSGRAMTPECLGETAFRKDAR